MAIDYGNYNQSGQFMFEQHKALKKTKHVPKSKTLKRVLGAMLTVTFLTNFTSIEALIMDQFDMYESDQMLFGYFDDDNSTQLTQQKGAVQYDISGNLSKKVAPEIRINRAAKTSNKYLIAQEKFVEDQKRRLAKIEAENAQKMKLAQEAQAKKERELKAAKLAAMKDIQDQQKSKIVLSSNKQDLSNAVKSPSEAAGASIKLASLTPTSIESDAIPIIPPMQAKPSEIAAVQTNRGKKSDMSFKEKSEVKILTKTEIADLKAKAQANIEANLPEEKAPMPRVHAGAEAKADLMLASITQKAHELEDKPRKILTNKPINESVVRSKKVPLSELNGFKVVEGKIASVTHAPTAEPIKLASINVPVPLKRPKNVPKSSYAIKKSKSASRNSSLISGRTPLTCLTTALYHEVRGESRAGQLAVAEVIKARVRSKSYPNTMCGVIYQNAHRRNACQFSFACDGKTDLPRDMKSWKKMKKLAGDFLAGRAGLRSVRGATHYHATYVSPKWRWAMNRIARIGTHIFYKDPKVRT